MLHLHPSINLNFVFIRCQKVRRPPSPWAEPPRSFLSPAPIPPRLPLQQRLRHGAVHDSNARHTHRLHGDSTRRSAQRLVWHATTRTTAPTITPSSKSQGPKFRFGHKLQVPSLLR